MTLIQHTHWCRHCGSHLQMPGSIHAVSDESSYCPICFCTELEELKDLGDE